MKRWLIHQATLVLIVAAVGLLVIASGVVPIKASTEHWPITKWLLSFSMSRSVATHSMGIDVPANLGDPANIMKGAGHFETGCAACHGSPLWPQPRIAQRLRPVPPRLQDKVSEWAPAELFYIVKHGVMFTGMPAFPSQLRDDEVWAVVAFLLTLPQLDQAGYRQVVYGDQGGDLSEDDMDEGDIDEGDIDEGDEASTSHDVPRLVLQACVRCHGLDGMGRDTSAFPRLASLHSDYFAATLKAYASGARHSGIMEPIAARLTTDEIRDAAAYYTSLARDPGTATSQPAEESTIERGRLIAADGIPDQDVGACNACHRADRSDHNPAYPVLTGQHAAYLTLQLQLFQRRQRGGQKAETMHTIADGLDVDQIRDVAAYYASLGSQSDSGASESGQSESSATRTLNDEKTNGRIE